MIAVEIIRVAEVKYIRFSKKSEVLGDLPKLEILLTLSFYLYQINCICIWIFLRVSRLLHLITIHRDYSFNSRPKLPAGTFQMFILQMCERFPKKKIGLRESTLLYRDLLDFCLITLDTK